MELIMSFKLGREKWFTLSNGKQYLLYSNKSTLVEDIQDALELLQLTIPLLCQRTGQLEPKQVVFEYKGF